MKKLTALFLSVLMFVSLCVPAGAFGFETVETVTENSASPAESDNTALTSDPRSQHHHRHDCGRGFRSMDVGQARHYQLEKRHLARRRHISCLRYRPCSRQQSCHRLQQGQHHNLSGILHCRTHGKRQKVCACVQHVFRCCRSLVGYLLVGHVQ